MSSYLSKLSYLVSRFPKWPRPTKQIVSPNSNISWCQSRCFAKEQSRDDSDKSVIRLDHFDRVENRTKETYLEMVNIYKEKERLRRGHVEFIYSALKYMNEFGVQKDLEVYKSLVDVFPKGKMIPTNIFQVEFMHYPKHQQCAIDLLEQMEENGVIPDWDMEDQLVNVFGSRGYPVRRYWRMMYWMPKWRNASPFPLPNPLPCDSLQLAKLAIHRITCADCNSLISVFKTSSVKDSSEDTWIVSSQSDEQRKLIEDLPQNATLYVEGQFRIWLRNAPLSYFVLRANPPLEPESPVTTPLTPTLGSVCLEVTGVWEMPKLEVKATERSVHYQEEGTVLAVCATGTSSKESLLCWLRCLVDSNPRLASMSILFRLEPVTSHCSSTELSALDQPTATLPPPQTPSQ